MLTAGVVMPDGTKIAVTEGTPQGGPLSPRAALPMCGAAGARRPAQSDCSEQYSPTRPARRTATLGDTKTGRSVRPLSHFACDALRNLAPTSGGERDALVFLATRGDGRMVGFPKLWARVAQMGGLPADVTPHTLRHSFASLAGDLGFSEPTIAALVGHKGVRSRIAMFIRPMPCCSQRPMRWRTARQS